MSITCPPVGSLILQELPEILALWACLLCGLCNTKARSTEYFAAMCLLSVLRVGAELAFFSKSFAWDELINMPKQIFSHCQISDIK